MSELLQFIIVVEFGALCFGCGFLTSFIVTRKRWRGEMIERGIAQYNSQTGVCGENLARMKEADRMEPPRQCSLLPVAYARGPKHQYAPGN